MLNISEGRYRIYPSCSACCMFSLPSCQFELRFTFSWKVRKKVMTFAEPLHWQKLCLQISGPTSMLCDELGLFYVTLCVLQGIFCMFTMNLSIRSACRPDVGCVSSYRVRLLKSHWFWLDLWGQSDIDKGHKGSKLPKVCWLDWTTSQIAKCQFHKWYIILMQSDHCFTWT